MSPLLLLDLLTQVSETVGMTEECKRHREPMGVSRRLRESRFALCDLHELGTIDSGNLLCKLLE